jgi:hypothetical protein
LGSALIYRLSVNPVFTTRAFWQPYLYLEPEGVNADDIARQLAVLQTDFPVREDQVPFELQGRQHVAIRRVVEFSFRCSDRYSLLIEYELEVQGCMTVLFLVDRQSGTKSQMGWSDLARWHPYCLHPEEFDALLADWERHDPRWHGQHLPLLLLCQFVGLPDSSSRDSLSARAEAALAAVCPKAAWKSPCTFRKITPGNTIRSSAGSSPATLTVASRLAIASTSTPTNTTSPSPPSRS